MKFHFVILIISFSGFSQSISRDVINSAGNGAITNYNNISWSLGEPVIGILNSKNNKVSNGYQQGLYVYNLQIEDVLLNPKVVVYPNPTSNLLNILVPYQTDYKIQIITNNGVQIFSGIIINNETIDLTTYSNSVYILTIQDVENNYIYTYKIIKQ